MSLIEPIYIKAFRFVLARWRYFAIGAGILLLLIVFYASCGKKEVKLDEKGIQEAKIAIAERDEKKAAEVLAKSDAQEAIADNHSVEAEKVYINTLKESREKWANTPLDEMAAELERRAKQ